MNSEQIHWWVKVVIMIVSVLLGKSGQISMASRLLEKHDVM